MTTNIQDVYRLYLKRNISLDALSDWLARNQWSLSKEEEHLSDEADVALIHLDDGHIDEAALRSRLQGALERYTTATIECNVKARPELSILHRTLQQTGTDAITARVDAYATSPA